MAVKYTIPYRSIDDTPWRVDILLDSWTDDAITVRGSADSACTIEYDGGVDDPFDNPIVSSKANIHLINQGELDMDELQYAGDRDFIVEVYRANELKWKGYLITDNIQQPFLSTPYVVQLSAIDGLNMLEGITFSINNLPAPPGGAIRCPLNWLRLVLSREQNLGMMLPIRWYIGLENVATEDDPIAGLMTWSPYGEGIVAGYYEDDLGNQVAIYQNCRYILEGLVKSFGCRIFQSDGVWCVMRTNDIIEGNITYNECDATLGIPTITQHTTDIRKLLSPEKIPGGIYKFIKEDALFTSKPSLSNVDVMYEADRTENIIPNGGFDSTILASPIYWGFNDVPNASPSLLSYDSITGQPGSAAEVSNNLGATEPAEFTFTERLPLDANILFNRFTFGFHFLPISGFPIETGTGPTDPIYGTIKWATHPLRIRVSYQAKDSTGVDSMMYLNRWGYWQSSTYTDTPMEVVSDVLTTSYLITFEGLPAPGDLILVRFIHQTDPSPDIEYSYSVNETAGDLSATLADFASTIAGASSTATTITIPSPPSGPWGGEAGVIRADYNLLPGNWVEVDLTALKVGDVASVVFQGKGGNNEILIPDPGLLNPPPNNVQGTLKFEFAVLPGQKYVLDDVWMRVEDNNDVYRASAGTHGKSQSITLGISSSLSGFMVSNMMRSYHQSNTDFLWSDGTVTASLTEHYARAVMRWRYKASKIFNGTINTRGEDWSFMDLYLIYSLDGAYLPLKATYNTERCEVGLVAMEGRDDGEITDVKHYASNNMPLSNYGG